MKSFVPIDPKAPGTGGTPIVRVSEDSVPLKPLLNLEHDLPPRHLELRRVLRRLRVHVGTVSRASYEDGRRVLAHVLGDPERVPRVDGPVHEHDVGHLDVAAAVHRVGPADAALEQVQVELGPKDVDALLLRKLRDDSAEFDALSLKY